MVKWSDVNDDLRPDHSSRLTDELKQPSSLKELHAKNNRSEHDTFFRGVHRWYLDSELSLGRNAVICCRVMSYHVRGAVRCCLYVTA